MSKEIQFFKNIQPGQQIFVHRNAPVKERQYEPLTVERLTATQIVCEGGRRFKRSECMPQEISGETWAVSPHKAAIDRLQQLSKEASYRMTPEQIAEETSRLENLIATQESYWP